MFEVVLLFIYLLENFFLKNKGFTLNILFHTGVTVYQPMYILNQSEIVIMFASGAGVEVVENKGFMSARVYLPWSHMVRFHNLRSF